MSETIRPPVNAVVTQDFGEQPDWDPNYYEQWGLPGHDGIDYGCAATTPVCPGLPGKLAKIAMELDGFGQYAVQDCGLFWLYYCHLTQGAVFAKVGDMLLTGRAFCYSGYTGAVYPKGSAGAHLHFGKKLKSYPKDDIWKGWRDPFTDEPVEPIITPALTGELVWVKADMYPRLRTEPIIDPSNILINELRPKETFGLVEEVDAGGRKWAKVACYIASEFMEPVK